MRTGRLDQTNSTQDFLGIRGAPAIDVSPVVLIDDMTIGPYQPFTPWQAGGAFAGVAAQYSTVSILNAGPANSRVVIDRLLVKAGGASSLFYTLVTKAVADSWGASYANAAADRRLVEPFAAQPQVAVNYGTFAVPGGFANQELVPRGDSNPFEVVVDLTLGAGMVAVFRWNLVNTALDWAAFGRYYDPA